MGHEVYFTLVDRLGMQGDNVMTNRIVLKRMFNTALNLVCKAGLSAAEAEGLVSDKKRNNPAYPRAWDVDHYAKEIVKLHPERRDEQEGLACLAAALLIMNTVEKWHPEAIKRTAAFIAELCAEEPQLSDGAMLLRFVNQEKPVKESSLQKINAIPGECVDSLALEIRSNARDLKIG